MGISEPNFFMKLKNGRDRVKKYLAGRGWREYERYVVPLEDKLGLYRSEVRALFEQPVCSEDRDARLLVIDQGRDHWKVRDRDGREGWVEKRLVVTVSASSVMTFDGAGVRQYLDNPDWVWIIEGDEPGQEPIRLDRTFAEALRDNVDQPTVERNAGR